MPSKQFHASLSENGWTNQPLQVSSELLLNLFTTQASQTYLFAGKMASYAYVSQKFQNDPEGMAQEINALLQAKLASQFDNVVVQTSVYNENGVSKAINVAASYTDSEGKSYDLSRVVVMTELDISKIQLT